MANPVGGIGSTNENAGAAGTATGAHEKACGGATWDITRADVRLQAASINELVDELAFACRDLPADAVAFVCASTPRIIRRVRGEPVDMDMPRPFCACNEGLYAPDFLKSRQDWIDDLVRAWRALGKDDRARFLMRVSGKEAA